MYGGRVVAVSVDHAAPAEMTREVSGRDAFEAHHPCLEATGVGVDVLHVTALLGVLTFRGDDPHVQNALQRGKGVIPKFLAGFDRRTHTDICSFNL